MPDDTAPSLDLHRQVAVLGAARVDFVMVGSAAAWIHGTRRRPNDLDVVIRDDWSNFEAVADALRRLRARPHVTGLTDEEAQLLPTRVDAGIVAELPISVWMTDAGELDLFDSLVHHDRGERDYDQLLADSTVRRISGVATPVASVADLVGAKRAADRDVDITDLAELEKVLQVHSRTRAPARPIAEPQRGLER
jgi:hypothetical protein